MRKYIQKSFIYSVCTGAVLAAVAILLFSKETVNHPDGTVEEFRGWSAVLSMLQHVPAGFLTGVLIALVCITVPIFVVLLCLEKRLNHKKRNAD